jgi:hypothetical protein
MADLMKFGLRFAAIFVVTASLSAANALRVKQEQVIFDKFEDYQLCQSKDYTGEWCHDALKRWVDQHPGDAFKAGKATRHAMVAHTAIPFFEQAFKAKKGDCKDEDVNLAVESALDLPDDANSAGVVKAAQEIGLKICLKEMKDKIVAGASVGSYRLKNICKVPAGVAALPPLKQAKCKDLK